MGDAHRYPGRDSLAEGVRVVGIDSQGPRLQMTFWGDSVASGRALLANETYVFSGGSVVIRDAKYSWSTGGFDVKFDRQHEARVSEEKVTAKPPLAPVSFATASVGGVRDLLLVFIRSLGRAPYTSPDGGAVARSRAIVVDSISRHTFTLTLWREDACKLDAVAPGDVLLVGGARVESYRGGQSCCAVAAALL